MDNVNKKKQINNIIIIAIICILCALTIALDFIPIKYVEDDFRNRMITKIIQQSCGIAACILLMIRLGIKLLGRPQKLLYMIPCFVVAIDNFQFCSFFTGKMELIRNSPLDFLLFAGYCAVIGLFEECVFRGIIFSVLAGVFPKNKKGLLLTILVSSIVFGLAHFLNGFSLGALLQAGYSMLTGGLFAFCLIKTKNIFCCAAVHSVYNFCGMLFDKKMLGGGVVFDLGTIITMVIVSVIIGVFCIIRFVFYKEKERIILYNKLGINE